jgi:hypothetical protein
MLAELDPKPDQVTVTVNTSQMNVIEQMDAADIAGTSLAQPENSRAYSEMIVPSTPSFFEEHVRRLSKRGIQSAFQFYNINSFETVERLIRRGIYKGPLVCNWVAIGGGMDQPTIYSLANFPARHPRRHHADGGVEHAQRAADQHDGHRDGPARALRHRGQPVEPVAHREDDDGQADRAAGAHVARIRPRDRHRQGSAKICKIGVFYDSVEETLAANGFAPNPKGGQQGFLRKAA